MTTPGYPDYTRLSRTGGVELGAASGNISNLQQIYKGYVGNFAYTAVTINTNVSADTTSVDLTWFSDSTFTQVIGFRRLIRNGSQFSETQYVNLSDWMIFQVETLSGSPMPFLWISAYGCQGPGDQISLVSTDVPILATTISVPATSTTQLVTTHVQPGDALFTLQTVAVSWFVNINYFDWGSAAYKLLRQYNSTTYVADINQDLPMLDAPYRIDVHNGDAAAKVFVLAYQSK